MEEQFNFNGKLRNISFGMIGLGVLAFIVGLFVHDSMRIWANLLVNSSYFVLIALAATFFIAAHRIGQAGWYAAIKRIPEAVSTFLPVGGIVLLIIAVGVWMHWNHLYHWADMHHVKGDEILEGKTPYLNGPFYTIRLIIYLAGWIIFTYIIRRYSLKQDQNPDQAIKFYRRTNTISALFLVFFAVTSSMASWDWLMSIDPHWYSTLYGWYVFASMWVSCLAVITLIVIYLKRKGHLEPVQTKHFRDLGQFMFGFSVFWMYLWFAQYLLIWYGNVPEETAYYMQRYEHYPVLFYANFILNFFIPFLVLMSAGAKKRYGTLGIAAVVIVIGHWIDFFLMVMPGTVGENWGLGFFEIGLFIGFAGLFIFVVFNALTKASLIPVNHPMLKESRTYHP